MRVAGHVAVGGHTDALGRGGNVPHRRERRRARRQGRGARERVALVRVTALLQQFLKLRAFVLKPYLHLERNAAAIIRPEKHRTGAYSEKRKKDNPPTRSPQDPAFLHFFLAAPLSPPLHPTPPYPPPFTWYLVRIPKVIVTPQLDGSLGLKQQHKNKTRIKAEENKSQVQTLKGDFYTVNFSD